jgi:hypothetical protein
MNFLDRLLQEELRRDIRQFERNDALFVKPQDLGFHCDVDECLGDECVVWSVCDCGAGGICDQCCGEE